jgi:hypothetical protein
MTPFTYWLAVSTVLQLSHPALATVLPAFANMAGLLGVGIPLVVGFLWARSTPMPKGAAFSRGFLLGWIPALIGLVLAFGLGQVTLMILVLGGISSGVAGALGAVVGARGES